MTSGWKIGYQSKYRNAAIAVATILLLNLPAHADDGKKSKEIKQAAITVPASPTSGRPDRLDISAYGNRFVAVEKAIKRAASRPDWEWECPAEDAGPS